MNLIRAGIISSQLTQSTSSFDTNAQAYFTATGITDPTIQNATNQLVLDLKTASLFNTKVTHAYPFPDNSSAHCAYNLINATSELTNTASAPVYASTGMTPNAVGPSYADTNISDSGFTFNDSHMSFYSRTAAAGTQFAFGIDGSSGGTGTICEVALVDAGTKEMTTWFFTGTTAVVSNTYATTQGLFTLSTQTGALRLYRNNTDITATSGTLVNGHRGESFLIGGVRGEAVAIMECAFFTLGTGLTGTDVTNLYNAIQTYQTSLSRNV